MKTSICSSVQCLFKIVFLSCPSQEHVVKEDLLSALYCEFINRVNEVGVDVNRAIAHTHTQSLVQYVCGLGPRKGSHLLKVCISAAGYELHARDHITLLCCI